MENKLLIQDLADAIAIKEGITKKKSEAFIKALFETIEEGLISDKFIKIKGLGTFKIISVGERESVNINTGERFSIEGHDKITFTPDTLLKDLINRPFAHFQTVIINEETNIEELENIDAENSEEEHSEEVANDDDGNVDDGVVESNNVEDEDLEDGNDSQESSDTLANEVSLDENEYPEENQVPSIEDTPTETPNVDMPAEVTIEEEAPSTLTDEHLTDASDAQPVIEKEDGNKAVLNAAIAAPVSPTASNEYTHSTSPMAESAALNTDSANQEETGAQTPSGQEVFIAPDDPSPETVNGSTTDEGYTPTSEEERANAQRDEAVAPTGTQEVKPEQIQYLIKELEGKRNIWKTTAMILLAILLLMLSYFAGYFRWFCPCEIMQENAIQHQNTSKPIPPEPTVAVNDSLSNQDSTIAVQALPSAPAEEQAQPEAEKPTSKKDPSSTVNQPEEKQSSPSSKSTANNFKQLEGGKYKIVGTIGKHEIIGGETIRTIALDVYGSKGYAPYIIVHNNIEDPNNVECGTILQLPKLERRNK